MIRELLDLKGYNAVLVVVDCLSKRIHTIPTVTSLDSTGVAWLFLKHVWHHHGLLEEVISDHRPTFMSNFSHELAALLGVKLTPSTSYHPHARGGCRLGAGERSAGEPESRLGWRDSQETTMGLSLGLLSRMGSVGWLPAWEGVSPGSFIGREFVISMKEKVSTACLPS